MKIIDLKCPNCGGKIEITDNNSKTTCEFCGSNLFVEEEMQKIDSYVNRAYDLLEQKLFIQAKDIANEGLVQQPYAGQLHLILLCCELNVSDPEELATCGKDFTTSSNYQNCIKYLGDEDKAELLKMVEANKNSKPKKRGINDVKQKYGLLASSSNNQQSMQSSNQFTAILLKSINAKIDSITSNDKYIQDDTYQTFMDYCEDNDISPDDYFMDFAGYVPEVFDTQVREQWFEEIRDKKLPQMNQIEDLDSLKEQANVLFKSICKEYSQKVTAEWKHDYDEIALHFEDEIANQQDKASSRSKPRTSSNSEKPVSYKQQKKEVKKEDNKVKSSKKLKVYFTDIVIIAIGALLLIPAFIGIKDEWGLFILIPAAIFVGFGLYLLLWYDRRRIKRSFCTKCGYHFDYENDIEWDEVERISENNRVTSVIEFTCHCEECGKDHTFREKFTMAYYDTKKNCWKENNVKNMAKKYFIR